jgi:transposase
MKKIAGLDVHSKSCTYVVQDEAGKVLSRGEVSTTAEALTSFVAEHALQGERVGLETGGMAIYVAQVLAAAKAKPVIIDAAEVRRKARSKKQKSDTRDAMEICDGLRRDQYVSIVKMPSEQAQRLRRMLSARRNFVRLRTAQTNAIKGLLRGAGLGAVLRDLRRPSADVALVKLQNDARVPRELKPIIELHRAVWKLAQKQIAKLDKTLEKEAKQSEDAELLQTIPGVGPIVSLTAVAVLDDVTRFDEAKHVGSYAGLVPQTYSSGESERYGRITKRGSGELRAMLIQAAQHARKKGHPLHSFQARISKRAGYKRALVAVAHKLIRIMWSMLKNQTSFDGNKHRSPAWKELEKIAA